MIDIDNALVVVPKSTQLHGSTVTVRCKAGFSVKGERILNCNDGVWSNSSNQEIPIPTCSHIGMKSVIITNPLSLDI